MANGKNTPSVSLNKQIRNMEQQLRQSQCSFMLQTASFKKCLREKLRTPTAIFVAAGVGFSIGYFNIRRNCVHAKEKNSSKGASLFLLITDILMIAGSFIAILQKVDIAPKSDAADQNKSAK